LRRRRQRRRKFVVIVLVETDFSDDFVVELF
jgi:hypothetical protein